MAVTVRITETYDLKTTKGRLGLIGIHTPQVTLLRKMYPGLMKNFKFMRFVKCDVTGASASMLPADPLSVGVSAGKVAPEDMFNPILYTAVTNESFDTLVARVRGLTNVSTLGSVAEGLAVVDSSEDHNFSAYYALLAENGKYRKAMPQTGFMIKGLVPLAHTVISTFGNVGAIGNTYALAEDGENTVPVPDVEVPELSQGWLDNTQGREIFYRGKSIKMPKFPLHTMTEELSDIPYPNVPNTTVLAMIIPPCKLNEFYYRLRVTWTVRFEGVCSTLEAGDWTTFNSEVGAYAYGRNYTFSSSKSEMDVDTDSVTADNVDIKKIMES